jgi:hypothetical protein
MAISSAAPWSRNKPLPYLPVTPRPTVEVLSDTAYEHGRYPQRLRFPRIRPDLTRRAASVATAPAASAAVKRHQQHDADDDDDRDHCPDHQLYSVRHEITSVTMTAPGRMPRCSTRNGRNRAAVSNVPR